jgi:adenosylhomocysteine nucleosidase
VNAAIAGSSESRGRSAGAAGNAGARRAEVERAGADRAGAAAAGAGARGVTAIVSPLAAELAGVIRLTRNRQALRVRSEGGSRRVIRGQLAGEEVALAATGDGAPAAAAGLAALLAALRPRRLLVLGVAGGLSPGLAAGSLVAARQVLADDGGAVPARDPDAAWLAQALRHGAIAGLAVSTRTILGTPEEKQAALARALRPEPEPASHLGGLGTAGPATTSVLAQLPALASAPAAAAMPALQPGSGTAVPDSEAVPAATAVAADLESAAYARVAAAWPLPYLVVRAVLDPADEELPLDFEACRDASGRVRNARVVLRALARPRRLADLWRLRSRLAGGAARLGAFAADLLAGVQTSEAAVLAGPADDGPGAAGGFQLSVAVTRRTA